LPISAVDMGTGMWTVIGLLAALRRREATGRGCVVRTSLFATALGWLSQRINTFVNEGVELPREAMSGHSGLVPYQAFSAADGEVFICVGNDRLFGKFCSTLGHPEWIADPAFATNRARLTNRACLVPLIASALAEQSRDYWCAHLGAAGVPCAPVNTLPEALALEQFAASDMLSPPLGEGAMQLVGIPLSFDGVHRHPQSIAPKLGADNALLNSPAIRR
jgi:formyl-CoA transferase